MKSSLQKMRRNGLLPSGAIRRPSIDREELHAEKSFKRFTWRASKKDARELTDLAKSFDASSECAHCSSMGRSSLGGEARVDE